MNHPSGARQNGDESTSTKSNEKHRNSSCGQGCSAENHSNNSIQRLAAYHPSGKISTVGLLTPRMFSPPAWNQETLIRLVKRLQHLVVAGGLFLSLGASVRRRSHSASMPRLTSSDLVWGISLAKSPAHRVSLPGELVENHVVGICA